MSRHPAYPATYALLYGLMVLKAREYGYALTLHGSLARDLDVVAIPWTEGAVGAEELVEALRETIGGWLAETEENPTSKPHGRLSWALHLGTGGYVDLGVMPRGSGGRNRTDLDAGYEPAAECASSVFSATGSVAPDGDT